MRLSGLYPGGQGVIVDITVKTRAENHAELSG